MELLLRGAPLQSPNKLTATYCSDQVMRFSSVTIDSKSNSVPDGLDMDRLGKGPAMGAVPTGTPKYRSRAQPRHPHIPAEKRSPDTGTLKTASGINQT